MELFGKIERIKSFRMNQQNVCHFQTSKKKKKKHRVKINYFPQQNQKKKKNGNENETPKFRLI